MGGILTKNKAQWKSASVLRRQPQACGAEVGFC